MDSLAKMILNSTSDSKRGEFGDKLVKYFTDKEKISTIQSSTLLGEYDTTVVSNVRKLQIMAQDKDLCLVTAYHWFQIEPEIRKKIENSQEVIYQTDVYLRASLFDNHIESYFAEGLGDPFQLIHYKFDERKTRLFYVSLSPGSEIDKLSDQQLEALKRKIKGNVITTYYFAGRGYGKRSNSVSV